MHEKLEKSCNRLKHRELIEYYYMVKNVAEQQVAGLPLDKENEWNEIKYLGWQKIYKILLLKLFTVFS